MSQTPKQFDEVINEGSTKTYTATLSVNGAPIALADIVSLTLTLQQVSKPRGGLEVLGAIVNGRDGQDVLNANNVTIHATSGLLTFVLQSLDTTILVNTNQFETHRATFQCTYSGANKLTWDVDFLIRNLLGIS